MKKCILIIIFSILPFSNYLTYSFGFEKSQLKNLMLFNQCPACDLRGAELHSTNLTLAELSSANLSEANLEEAFLDMASLNKANLEEANLTRTNLQLADITGVIFCKTKTPWGEKKTHCK